MEKIQIVLASPSDLKEERMMIKDLIESYNSLFMKQEICFDLRMWEDSLPGMNDKGPQGLIDEDLDIPHADIFICLFGDTLGTKIEGENVSGTEHELNIALENYNNTRKPDIKVYFKKNDSSNKKDILFGNIIDKFKRKGLYDYFKTSDDLKDKITKVINKEAMDYILCQTNVRPLIKNYIEIPDTVSLITYISSNNKLLLYNKFYDLLDFDVETEHVFKRKVYDGEEVVIKDISNLTIVGDSSTLLVSPRYASVISFENCSNIKLIGLTVGHTPHKGYCSGSVLNFKNCEHIQLESMELFGCGTYGIELMDCSSIHINGTKIFECTYGAVDIIKSDLFIENSEIYDCYKLITNLFSLSLSELVLKNVYIHNNDIDNYMFDIFDSSLFCIGVSAYDNSYYGLTNDDNVYDIYELNNNIIYD